MRGQGEVFEIKFNLPARTLAAVMARIMACVVVVVVLLLVMVGVVD